MGTTVSREIQYESHDGLKLFARQFGAQDGMPVMCLHGLTRNHRDFGPLIRKLPRRYNIIAPDQRGRGKSQYDKHVLNYRPDIYVQDMVRLMDTLEIESAVIIGTSMGGLMGMLMARTSPGRLRGLVLNDVGPQLRADGLNRIAGYAGDATAPAKSWREATRRTRNSQRDAFPRAWPGFWGAFTRRLWSRRENGEIRLDYDPAIMAAIPHATSNPMMTSAMWNMYMDSRHKPMLIIRGGLSDILTHEAAERMVKRHYDARLITVPNVGHAPMLSESIAVKGILDFLANIEASG